jgi:hypothetical protein
MPGPRYKRTDIKYEPTGPVARAALDFASEAACFKNFGANGHGLPADELRKLAIALFEDRQVASATLSKVTPKTEHARQPFTITFKPTANGYVPKIEIEIKSVKDLQTQAKLYKADSTAYSGTRKPKARRRNLDETL